MSTCAETESGEAGHHPGLAAEARPAPASSTTNRGDSQPTRRDRLTAVWTRARWPVALTALVDIPLLFWFLGFKPGIMTADSLSIWHQALVGRWSDAHPPAYIASMRVSQLLVDSPAVLTLGQQVYLASALAAVAIALRRIGAPRIPTYGALAIVACSPMVGAFSVSVWKDVPYSASLLHIGAALIELTRARRSRPAHASLPGWPVAYLAAAAFAATHSRQNGIIMVTALAAVLFITLAGLRRRVILAWAAIFATVLLAKVVVYPLVDIAASPPELTVASLIHDLGAVVHHHPETIDDDDRAVLEQFAPLATWSSFYSCYTVDTLYYQAGLDYTRMDQLRDDLVAEWREALFEAPGTIIGHRLCAGSIAWRPMAVNSGTSVLYTVSAGIDPNQWNLETTPVVETFHGWGLDALREVGKRDREWYLWRAPTWIYGAYVALAIAAIRSRSKAVIVIGAPLLAQQLSVTTLNPAQDARYMMGALMLAVMLLPVARVRPTARDDRSSDRSDEGEGPPDSVGSVCPPPQTPVET